MIDIVFLSFLGILLYFTLGAMVTSMTIPFHVRSGMPEREQFGAIAIWPLFFVRGVVRILMWGAKRMFPLGRGIASSPVVVGKTLATGFRVFREN